MVDSWLEWAKMKAKPSKCHSTGLAASSGKMFDPLQSISGDITPYVGREPIKFLSLEIQIPPNQQKVRKIVSLKLQEMLQGLTPAPSLAAGHYIHSAAICPRLSWLLMVREFPITWVKSKLEGVATQFLKKWSGLARCANTAILYMKRSSGGLNLPSLATLYKRLQVSRQCQLLICSDPCVHWIAE